MKQVFRALAAFFVLSIFSSGAHAFPELVRHGYINCTTCHVSPNGGGVLTEYGRALSEEILSTGRYEGEGKFAYGIVNPPQWLVLGGDFRELQLFTNSPTMATGRFILMQNDLEASVKVAQFSAVATGGYFDQPGNFGQHLISRRHYLMYQPTAEMTLRAGLFMKAFGINLPDHAVFTKQLAGMDQGMETYNAEASYIGEKFDAYATLNLGRPDDLTLQREHGVALRASVPIGETYKVGLGYNYGENDLLTRHLFGPYAILGFTPRSFLLAELDFQSLTQPKTTSAQFGALSYLRADYEFIQGLHVFLTHEFSQMTFGDNTSMQNAGGGIQFFPRPHFEFQGIYKHLFAASGPMDLGAFLLHFYP